MKFTKYIHMLFICVIVMQSIPNVMAEEWGWEVDVKGSKDHPMFTRYPGSLIKEYSFRKFDEYQITTAKDNAEYLDVEGKVTKILYGSSEGVSPAEMFRNYAKALEEAGFEDLFVCKQEDRSCWYLPDDVYGVKGLYKEENDCRYRAAKLTRDEGNVFVVVNVCSVHDWPDYSFAFLRVIEEETLETGLITVNAEKLQEDILAQGHVELEGVFFDTNKATLKPESKPTLDEVGKLLSENTNLNLLVVGHTDNVGKLDYNVDLSNRRAQSVVSALINDYGIDASRLNAFGAGMFAPIASNASEEGRKQNRRVELVQR